MSDTNEKKDAVDLSEVVQLLTEIKKSNEEQLKFTKIHTICSGVTALVLAILVIAILVFGSKVMPLVETTVGNVNGLITQVNEVIDQAKGTIDELQGIANQASDLLTDVNTVVDDVVVSVTDTLGQVNGIVTEVNGQMDNIEVVIENLNKISTDLSAVQLDSVVSNVNELVVTGEESLGKSVEKIDDIDIEGLNDAISNLSSVIAPLAKLFGKK